MNFQKSNIFFSKKVLGHEAKEIAQAIGMSSTADLGRYLGAPSIHGRVNTSLYPNLLDRVQTKLDSWKMKFLSLAGRHALVQSVITSIPLFQMQTALLPRGLCEALDTKSRGFLWGDTMEGRKTHLINWETVTKEKSKGGLGIRKMQHMNKALMAKLGWKLLTDRNKLWVRVL